MIDIIIIQYIRFHFSPVEKTDQRIDGKDRYVSVIRRSIGHPIDVIRVIIVAGQRYRAAVCFVVNHRVAAAEEGPEIADSAIVLKYRLQGLELVANGVFGLVLEAPEESLAIDCHRGSV